LPTPWNSPASPASDNVIEFGGLDDSSLELPPIAGRIAASEEASPAESPAPVPTLVAETSEDPETFEQLCHIQKLLADIRVEFQPAAAVGPEVELVFDAPHPFAEPFEEEEVIADRYAVTATSPVPNPPAAEPAATPAAAAIEEAEPAQTSSSQEEPVPEGGRQAWAPATAHQPVEVRRQPRPETVPMPHGRKAARIEQPETSVAAATVAAIANDASLQPARSPVPPPRQELGRLFAKLRRGL
jgi:hypothetical protein